MKSLMTKFSHHLLLAIVIATPSILASEIAGATTSNTSNKTSASVEYINSKSPIQFSSNLSEKLKIMTSRGEGVLAARPQFGLFDNGPSFVQNRPYQVSNQGNYISAVETFNSIFS